MKIVGNSLAAAGLLLVFRAAAEPDADVRWMRSYDAGYVDANGAYAGGSEIMHLAAHKGKLYAANGYWVDARWVIPPDPEKQSAQVLRLDAADARWQVELDLGRSTGGLGLRYMKGNILKSVTFTRDAAGRPLPAPQTLLVMAAGANVERGGAVSAWVRDDATGSWSHTLVRHGSNAGGVRWVPRDMEIHRDRVTGVEHLLLSLGNPGIVSGVYDPAEPGNIRWNRHLEYPFPEAGSLVTRPLGMTRANRALFFSEGGAIYRRVDGKRPGYEKMLDLYEDTDTDIGGIRGLTTIANPTGPGESLLFLWAPAAGSQSRIVRLDPDGSGGYAMHHETRLADLMSKRLGVEVPYTLGAHNMMYPVKHPVTGETVHLIGFQGNIRGKHHLRWKGSALYGGAQYAVRKADRTYTVLEVNNDYAPGKAALITPRAFCLSPFGDGDLYFGGHDASRRVSDDMAWIFRAPLEVALGLKPGRAALPPRAPAPPAARLLAGPMHELRIYAANEGRHRHLIKRFREHTDRLFRKHGMKALGYWIPTDGTYKQKRKFVYLLEHPSRYAAYKNWIAFSNDREWERVLDEPGFKGLLSGKPESMFMTADKGFSGAADSNAQPGGVYELRTCTANPGRLDELTARFRDQTARALKKHGILTVGCWRPLDKPESADTLIQLVHHAGRAQADANWKAFHDDAGRGEAEDASQRDGELLARPPERLYLKALDFSPLK